MNVSALADTINALPAVKAGSIRFWGDWFGRPYDNHHRVLRCSAVGETLLVEFHDGELLTIQAPEGVTVDADVFRVKNAKLVRWDWYRYGRPRSAANRCFYEYVRDGSGIEVTTNVERRERAFAPSPTENAVEIV